MTDLVNHPPHYQAVCNCPNCGHAIEAIQITERFGFRVGNAIKYLLRAGRKGDAATDLGKARWYVDRELAAQPTIRTPQQEQELRAAQLRNAGGCDDAPVTVTADARRFPAPHVIAEGQA